MIFSRNFLSLILILVLTVGVLVLPASAAENLMYGIGFVNASSLRLRSAADDTASVITSAQKGECVVVIAKEGQWYKVNYNLHEGYMHEDYLTVSTKENAELGYGSICGSAVNLRTGPSTSYGVAAVGNTGDKCYILGLNEGWYKVLYKDKICYIRSDFLVLTEIPYENKASANTPKFFRGGKSTGLLPSDAALNGQASSPSSEPITITGSSILAEAQKYLGTPYAAGGASPGGFDCSGLVYYVLKQVGYSPYRTPADQIKHSTAVSKNSLKPGDLVFFSSNGGRSVTHVGIYSGNGQFIHAPNSRSVVSYSDLTTGYWSNTYYAARRVSM